MSDTGDEIEFVESSTGGRKQKKPDRWDLLPWDALEELAILYGRGAEKYSERNWELGLNFGWSYRALINHSRQWWMGEDTDPEMGVSHLACVAFHALGMLALQKRHGNEWDDRPSSVNRSDMILQIRRLVEDYMMSYGTTMAHDIVCEIEEIING